MKDLTFFESRVVKTVTERNEALGPCWLWTLSCSGGHNPSESRPSYTEDGKTKLAAREIYRLIVNPNIKDGIKYPVLHRCVKQSKCINPAHLYYKEEDGPKQNRLDAVAQGTIPLRKLYGHEDEIIKLFHDGVKQQEIAKKLNVCPTTILRFLNGHYDAQPINYVKQAEEKRDAKIRELFNQNKSLTTICLEVNCATTVVFRVVPEIRDRAKGQESEESKQIKTNMSLLERNREIKKMKEEGKSVREIAVHFHISTPLVYTVLKQIT